MTKLEWQEHYCATGPHDTKACAECAKRRRTQRANRSARELNSAMRSLGMIKTPYGWE